jgi:hypothetical protein
LKGALKDLKASATDLEKHFGKDSLLRMTWSYLDLRL